MNKPLKREYHYNKDAKHTSLTTSVTIPLRELKLESSRYRREMLLAATVEGISLDPGWSIDNGPNYASAQLGVINEEGLFSSDLEPYGHTREFCHYSRFGLLGNFRVHIELDNIVRYRTFKVTCDPEWVHSLPRNSAISIIQRWTVRRIGVTNDERNYIGL